ncbi:hypothetical protein PM082_003598 [Marasmius tenuissimus]|nr:hypothetical protein PM082_003598 [Marasmius tenuissimus]
MEDTTARRPILPPEILEQIVDELEGSFPALKSCSLVCHDWLARTRCHLFRSITLPPTDHNLPNTFEDISPATFDGTSVLGLLHSSPFLTNYVRRLTLDFRYSAQLVCASEPYLVDLIPRMKQLVHLTLFMFPIHNLSSSMERLLKSDLLNASPLLRTITIDSCVFEDARSFWDILHHASQLSSLEHLTLIGLVLKRLPSEQEVDEIAKSPKDDPAGLPKKRARLHSLELGQMSVFPLFSALFTDPNALFDLTALRRVKIRDIGALFFYAELWRVVGSSITHLDFEVGKYVRDEYVQPHFSSFTSLTHLTLSVVMSRFHLQNLLMVLSHVHLIPTLRHLHIVWPQLNTTWDVFADAPGCNALDVVLAGLNVLIRGLEKITIEMRCHCWQHRGLDSVEDCEKRMLVRTDRTGLLDFQVLQISGYTMYGEPIFLC